MPRYLTLITARFSIHIQSILYSVNYIVRKASSEVIILPECAITTPVSDSYINPLKTKTNIRYI
jgi:hypothetical protein